MNTNFISLKTILDSLLDHPLLQEVTLERAVAYTVEFLRLIGVPDTYQEVIDTVKVENHRGVLPCDLYEIIQVRDAKNHRVYNYSTSSFHTRDGADNFTYKRQGNIIVTSTKECEMEIAYRAMVVDDEGLPMVPDNAAVTRALELYIKRKVFTILFDLNRISGNALQQVLQDYGFAIAQARNALLMPSEDEWEAISNNMNSMLPRTNAHATGFKFIGNKERMKLH